jgi:hypothetical protein
MKKLIMAAMLGIALLNVNAISAQEGSQLRNAQEITAVKNLKSEISLFEQKTKGNSEYKNAAADMKALRQKYSAELRKQISLNENNQQLLASLREELELNEQQLKAIK